MKDTRSVFKKYFWLWLLGAVIGIGIAISFVQVPVTITEAQAQAMLDTKLAEFNEKSPDTQIGPLILKFGDGTMTLDAQGVGPVLKQTISAHLYADGLPEKNGKHIYFRASDFEVTDMMVNDLPPHEAMVELVQAGSKKLMKKRDEVLAEEPKKGILSRWRSVAAEFATDKVVEVNSAEVERLIVKYKSETKQFLEGLVVSFLQSSPIYSLDHSGKEKLAASVLTDITVAPGQVTAVLSGMEFMKTLITAVLTLLIAIAWVAMLFFGGASGFGLALGALAS
ncbi:MAG: DUF1439 domain-containing protein [Candidatus Kaiserbacteria bacterium]|nr:DUF1439 domain-containing protein [Candidatus Kaiserbacteria bacterium]MCB9816615.1 DUF1439 domain-containing protein [Candidatus Nomurabacteria bacterium]